VRGAGENHIQHEKWGAVGSGGKEDLGHCVPRPQPYTEAASPVKGPLTGKVTPCP
jgi:hypothetical protein